MSAMIDDVKDAGERYEWTFDVSAADLEPRNPPAPTGPAPVEAARDGTDPEETAWYKRMGRYLEISALLRVFGAGVMIAAIGVFLFQRWEAGNDLFRYSMLLSQTLLLSLLGFATSRWLREPKSARVFIALGLVSTAASFTVVGALLYSVVQWDAVSTYYPSFAFWHADSLGTALTWAGGSLLVLAPLTRVGFTVLARPAARSFAWLFLANTALLLIPARDPALMAAVAAAAAVASFMVLSRVRSAVPAVRTPEGRIARLLVLLPVGIIAGRAGYLYAADATSIAFLGLLGYATLRQMGVNADRHPRLKRTLEIVSLAPALVTALACGAVAVDAVGVHFDVEAFVATVVVLLIAACMDLSRRSGDGGVYAATAAWLALAGGGLELALAPSMGTALLCAAVSGGVAYYAHCAGHRVLYWLALLGLLAALGHHVQLAMDAFDLGGWAGLAALGTGAIVLAAAIERHGDRVKAFLAGPARHA